MPRLWDKPLRKWTWVAEPVEAEMWEGALRVGGAWGEHLPSAVSRCPLGWWVFPLAWPSCSWITPGHFDERKLQLGFLFLREGAGRPPPGNGSH